MNYEAIVEGYSDELKLMDAVDMLNRDPVAASEILDYVASRSNNEKTDVQPLETGPTEVTFSQDLSLIRI